MRLSVLVLPVILAFPRVGLAEQTVDCDNALTTLDMRTCAHQDFVVADKELNADYQRALSAMQDLDVLLPNDLAQGEDTLRRAQRAWLTYRDLACEAQGYIVRGGSLEPIIVTHCREDMTRQRSEYLRLIWAEN
ncbi:MAG: lysozyme inhibitor LprI family protein [Pseudoruegeria sp.]